MNLDLLFLILISLIVAGILFFIVMAIRASRQPRNRGSSNADSSGTYDSGQGWTATDYSSGSDASDATPDFGDAFGGGDAGGGGSGGDWGDAGGGGDSGGGGDGGGGDGGGGDGGGGGE